MTRDFVFDREAYQRRIGLRTGHYPPDIETLTAVHRGQMMNVPFENLDVLMGRGIDVAISAVFDKVVRQRRGGYCFELNRLLCAGLDAMGFKTRLALGRVVLGGRDPIPPRTHAVGLIDIEGQRFMVDAGFGAQTPRAPILVEPGGTYAEGAYRWQLVEDEELGLRLTMEGPNGVQDLYGFQQDWVFESDVVLANHWTSTAPTSHFRLRFSLARHQPNGVHTLGEGARYRAVVNGQVSQDKFVAQRSELEALLRDSFGLEFEATDEEWAALMRLTGPGSTAEPGDASTA